MIEGSANITWMDCSWGCSSSCVEHLTSRQLEQAERLATMNELRKQAGFEGTNVGIATNLRFQSWNQRGFPSRGDTPKWIQMVDTRLKWMILGVALFQETSKWTNGPFFHSYEAMTKNQSERVWTG